MRPSSRTTPLNLGNLSVSVRSPPPPPSPRRSPLPSTVTSITYYMSHCSTGSPLIYSLTVRGVGSPQMISQPVSSIYPCSPLPSRTWRTPGLSIPWCTLPASSSICLVFFPLSLCLARWFWPDLMNGRHDHTTAVCVSLRWSGLRVVQLPAGSWHGLPRW